MEEEVESSQPPVPPLPAVCVCVCVRERGVCKRELCTLCAYESGWEMFYLIIN